MFDNNLSPGICFQHISKSNSRIYISNIICMVWIGDIHLDSIMISIGSFTNFKPILVFIRIINFKYISGAHGLDFWKTLVVLFI